MTLRVRLGLAAGVAVALAVIAVAVSAYAGTRSELRGQIDQSLQSLAQPILMRASGGSVNPPAGGSGFGGAGSGGLGFGGSGSGSPGRFDSHSGTGSRPGPASPTQADCDLGLGLDLGSGPGLGGAPGLREFISRGGRACQIGGGTKLPVGSSAKAVAAAGKGRYFSDITLAGHPFRLLVTGLPGRGALQVALPLTDIDHALSDQRLLLALIAAGGIALAALLGILVARTALGPIERFTRQTEAIAANPERLDQERLEVHGRDELARLAQTFNRTLDALERSVEAQRNLVADASHELRTPIATIRANLQLMRDEALLSASDRDALRADVIEELDELTALVGDVELARGSKPTGEPGDVRVDEIVAAAAERTRRRAPTLDVQCRLEPTLVRGEGARISRAVTNLFDNAAKWSPPGGLIEVDLHDGTLTVRDHGPGFQREDLQFVFDRFHRARDARSKPGSGLGLAIVRQAAEAHGGFVVAANAPGGGALMRIGFGEALELSDAETEASLSA
jgi:two-component system, OmpR family, sensor histidine kinase MprB